ncbi:hypothetical protein V5799_007323 [Amblyomma americanum]|uniref:Peptidase M12B domain-containing protein n=1 Tax=Amblyomma americanum TaxID=6943 RepID=A0AAQ4DTV4_AMBAM
MEAPCLTFLLLAIYVNTSLAASPSKKRYVRPDTFVVETCFVATREYENYYTDYVHAVAYFGLARTSSVCTDMKVAIVHDIPNSYAAVVTLAHEVAHLLGATHDGQVPLQRPNKPPGSKKCPPTDGYLMGNGDLGANKYMLSSCSMAQIRARYK